MLLNQWHLMAEHQKWSEWPYLLIIFGAVFFIYGWVANESDLLFPAFLMLGIGLHAFFPNQSSWWSKNATFYPLLMGIGFLIRYAKVKKQGLWLGLLLLLFGLYPLFSKALEQKLHQFLGTLGHDWPILLVALGLFLFLKKK